MPISIEQARAAIEKIKFNTTGSVLLEKVGDADWIENHVYQGTWAGYTTYQRVVFDGEDIFFYGAGIGNVRHGKWDLPVQKFSFDELEEIVQELRRRRSGDATSAMTMTASLQQRVVKVRLWVNKASGQEMAEVSHSSWGQQNGEEENQ